MKQSGLFRDTARTPSRYYLGNVYTIPSEQSQKMCVRACVRERLWQRGEDKNFNPREFILSHKHNSRDWSHLLHKSYFLILLFLIYSKINASLLLPPFPQKLALTSPTSGGRSVGKVRLRTKSHGVFSFSSSRLYCISFLFILSSCFSYFLVIFCLSFFLLSLLPLFVLSFLFYNSLSSISCFSLFLSFTKQNFTAKYFGLKLYEGIFVLILNK
jgi:hypothetical protein